MAPGSGHERTVARGEGYVLAACGQAMRLPVLAGSYVYSPSSSDPAEGRGCLYRVATPTAEEGGVGVLVGLEALLVTPKWTRRSTAPPTFEVKPGDRQRWRPDPRQVWTVDHLVEEAALRGSGHKLTFDFVRANAEIAAQGGGGATGEDWEAVSLDGAQGEEEMEVVAESPYVWGAGGR